MKLSYEDKLEIYKLKKNGWSWVNLSQIYKVTIA
ncbi:fucose isomerase, partial [Streptococcus pluranimalium]